MMARKKSQSQIRKEALAKKQQRRRNLLLGILVAMLVVTTAVFVIIHLSDNETATNDLRTAPEVGALAPDFELAGIDRETVRLSDFRGQPVAVTFMHTW
jgi:cytochrome oxidase Cu insertion factor (SCO1/SenC/PrrC family)